jgi:hypothetical protein
VDSGLVEERPLDRVNVRGKISLYSNQLHCRAKTTLANMYPVLLQTFHGRSERRNKDEIDFRNKIQRASFLCSTSCQSKERQKFDLNSAVLRLEPLCGSSKRIQVDAKCLTTFIYLTLHNRVLKRR